MNESLPFCRPTDDVLGRTHIANEKMLQPLPIGCHAARGQTYSKMRTFLFFKGNATPDALTEQAASVHAFAQEHANRVFEYTLGNCLGGGTDAKPVSHLNVILGRWELQLLRLIPRLGGELPLSSELQKGRFADLGTPATLGKSKELAPSWTKYNRRLETLAVAARMLEDRLIFKALAEVDKTTLVDEVPDVSSTVSADVVAISLALVKLLALIRETTELPQQFFLWHDRRFVKELERLPLDQAVDAVMSNDDPSFHAELGAAYLAWETYCRDVVLPHMAKAALVVRLERADGLSSSFVMYEDHQHAVASAPTDGVYRNGRFVTKWNSIPDNGIDWVDVQYNHLQWLVAAIRDSSAVDSATLAAYTCVGRSETTPGAAGLLQAALVTGAAGGQGGNTNFISWNSDYTAAPLASCAEVAESELGVLTECLKVAGDVAGVSMTDDAPIGLLGHRSFAADQASVTAMGAKEGTHVRLGGSFSLGEERVRLAFENRGRNLILSESWLQELLPDYLNVQTAPIGKLAFTAVFAHSRLPTDPDTIFPDVIPARELPPTVLEHAWDRLGGTWCVWRRMEADGFRAWMLDVSNNHAEKFIE